MTIENQKEEKKRGEGNGAERKVDSAVFVFSREKREDRHEDSKKLLVGERKRALTLKKGEGRIDVTSERERDLCRLFILFVRSE